MLRIAHVAVLWPLAATAQFCSSGLGGAVINPCASDSTDYCCDCTCSTCGPREFCLRSSIASECGVCNPSYRDTAVCGNHYTRCSAPPPPPPAPRPPPPTFGFLDVAVCEQEFELWPYDREYCEENIRQLPFDVFVGGAIILVLAILPLQFYACLLRRRWRSAGTTECPFFDGRACNTCRSCGTRVSDAAFVRTCSVTTQTTNGNVTTMTTTTTHNWDHCVGCHYLKTSSFNTFILVMMTCLWALTVVERTLAVLAVAPYTRDERVNTFGLIPYWLTGFIGLMQLAIIWCNRKALTRWATLVPCCGCCCPSTRPAASVRQNKAPTPAAIKIEMGPKRKGAGAECGGQLMVGESSSDKPPVL